MTCSQIWTGRLAEDLSPEARAEAGPRSAAAQFALANERTFLSWQRTALGMLAAGVGVLHLFDRGAGVWFLGVVLIGGGGVVAALGLQRYRHAERAFAAGDEMPPLFAATVLVVLVLLAVVAGLLSTVL